MRKYTKHKTFDAKDEKKTSSKGQNNANPCFFSWRWEHALHFSSEFRPTAGRGLFARHPRAKAHAAV